jgi:hypothetical protein
MLGLILVSNDGGRVFHAMNFASTLMYGHGLQDSAPVHSGHAW